MKRQISLLIMSLLMMLNITPVYAVDEEPQYCIYKINEESIENNKVILDKTMIDTLINQQNSSYTYEDIKIVNELPYEIQLENSKLCIPSSGELYFASLLYNANALSTDRVYTYTDILSYYQDSLIFYPATIHGYVFLDNQKSGMFQEECERVKDISIDLWQGSNLIETCVSDEQGYYAFKTYDKTLSYTITIENLNDYILTKYNEGLLGNHFQLSQDSKVSLNINENTHQNIGLQKKIYTVQYIINDKVIQKQYHDQDEVTLYQDNLEKDGYTFVEWNTQKDGSGESYRNQATFIMQKHNLTLYPIYKQDETKEIVKNNVISTSDDSQITFLVLLLLGSVAGIIVSKVLKKNKNR
ncbi:MAG: InlB B-repeat-containing protein [Coprobacillus sp.]